MLIKIIKSVFKYLDIKHLALYTFANLLNVFSKIFELFGNLPFTNYTITNQPTTASIFTQSISI